MARRLLLLTVLAIWAQSALAGVRLAPVSGEPVPVYVQAGAPLAVTFPEAIQAIPTGVDPAALSLEIEGRRLFVQPLVEGFDARLFVIGEGGRMYQLHLTEGNGEPDDQVELVLPAAPPVFGAEAPPETAQAPVGARRRNAQTPLRRLLVAMIDKTSLPGVSVVDHAQSLFDDGRVEIYTVQLYVAGRYLGYVAVAENRGPAPVALRLPEYQAPGLRAIAAQRETLEPNGTTVVYLVVEPGRRR